MDVAVLLVFLFVYGGMILGELPGLALDRSGIALLGAIALIAIGRSTPEAAWESVDVPTLALLFGLMVVSAQFRLGGFYSHVTRSLASIDASPKALLGALIAVAGLLSRFSPTTSSALPWRRSWSRGVRRGGSIRCRTCSDSLVPRTSARP
jgi:Na+/H+ antiporter NhaD/arsenite permease-like protein